MQLGSAIPAPSKRHALDWSLVLLSQGIESVIEPGIDGHAWELKVEPPDYSRALSALQQYRAENPRRFWRQEVAGSGMLFDWTSLLWMILLGLVYALEVTRMPFLRTAGLMDGQAVQHGEWWRLFTALQLHADLHHLFANITIGVFLLGLAMGTFGAGHALLAAYLSGVLANALSMVLDPGHRNLGASGMVMGALGLLTAQSFHFFKQGFPARRAMLRALLGGVLLLVLLGFSPGSDVPAHIAGFLFGLLFGAVLVFVPGNRLHRPLTNRIAEALCAFLLALTWWLALRST